MQTHFLFLFLRFALTGVLCLHVPFRRASAALSGVSVRYVAWSESQKSQNAPRRSDRTVRGFRQMQCARHNGNTGTTCFTALTLHSTCSLNYMYASFSAVKPNTAPFSIQDITDHLQSMYHESLCVTHTVYMSLQSAQLPLVLSLGLLKMPCWNGGADSIPL